MQKGLRNLLSNWLRSQSSGKFYYLSVSVLSLASMAYKQTFSLSLDGGRNEAELRDPEVLETPQTSLPFPQGGEVGGNATTSLRRILNSLSVTAAICGSKSIDFFL